MEQEKQDCVARAMDHFGGLGSGGMSRLAEAIGTMPSTIWNWKKRGWIPPRSALDIERATGGAVTAKEVLEEYEGIREARKGA